MDGRLINLCPVDLEAWQRKPCHRRYGNKLPQCRVPLRDEELPEWVTQEAKRITSQKPIKKTRKYYCDVTQAQWEAIRKYVLLRDGECVYCGAEPTQVDHIIPVSRRGSWHPDNCVAACGTCNASKGAMTPSEWHKRKRNAEAAN